MQVKERSECWQRYLCLQFRALELGVFPLQAQPDGTITGQGDQWGEKSGWPEGSEPVGVGGWVCVCGGGGGGVDAGHGEALPLCVCVCVCMCMYSVCVCMYIYVYVCIYTYIRMYVCILMLFIDKPFRCPQSVGTMLPCTVYAHKYIHTYIHTYTYTHTHRCWSWRSPSAVL